jgi:tetrahydromethanopterin S-methyltransferase subunit G
MATLINGCAYGKVTRERVDNIEKCVMEIKESIENISNHYSQRLPTWVTVILALCGTIIGALLTAVLTRAL